MGANRGAEDMKAIRRQEEAHAQELRQLDSRIKQANAELSRLTAENADCLNRVASLTSRQKDLDEQLASAQTTLSPTLLLRAGKIRGAIGRAARQRAGQIHRRAQGGDTYAGAARLCQAGRCHCTYIIISHYALPVPRSLSMPERDASLLPSTQSATVLGCRKGGPRHSESFLAEATGLPLSR